MPKVRLATACERAGLPMERIAAAIRAGRLSFSFLEAAVYRRWRMHSGRTYRQVSQDTGVPLELLGSFLEAIGFARMAPDELIREDELEVVPLLQLGLSSGFLDQVWSTRLGRGYQEGLRLIAQVEKELWQARFMAPMLEAGTDQQTAMERAAQRAADINYTPVLDRALLATYCRQQELAWTEQLVEDIETALEDTGVLGRPERVPAMCFLDLVGYTRLTEEQGDQVAAELAEALAVLVGRFAREHGGVSVKWLGDGVMVWFREPAGVVLSALSWWPSSPRPACRQPTSGWRPGRWWSRAATTRPHREPGRPDRRLCQRQSSPGERARGPSAAPEGVTFAELGRCSFRASPIQYGCWKPAGRNADASVGKQLRRSPPDGHGQADLDLASDRQGSGRRLRRR